MVLVKLVKKLTLCSFELLRLCVLGLADASVKIEYTEPPPQDGSTTVEIDYSEPPPPGGSDEMEYFEIRMEFALRTFARDRAPAAAPPAAKPKSRTQDLMSSMSNYAGRTSGAATNLMQKLYNSRIERQNSARPF